MRIEVAVAEDLWDAVEMDGEDVVEKLFWKGPGEVHGGRRKERDNNAVWPRTRVFELAGEWHVRCGRSSGPLSFLSCARKRLWAVSFEAISSCEPASYFCQDVCWKTGGQ